MVSSLHKLSSVQKFYFSPFVLPSTSRRVTGFSFASKVNRVATLEFKRTKFELLREIVSNDLWEST